MLNLMTAAGALKVDRSEIDRARLPQATRTYQPIGHGKYVDGVVAALGRSGLEVVSEVHALGREGARYFGMFELRSGQQNTEDYSLVMGLRNSHDQTFPAGLVVGAGVLVCDNLSFSGEIKIGRKHTTHIERDLPQLI